MYFQEDNRRGLWYKDGVEGGVSDASWISSGQLRGLSMTFKIFL